MIDFVKDFDDDFIHCGQIELDWQQVDIDIDSVSGDHTRDVSVVDGAGIYNDSLKRDQNEYAKYGYTKHNTVIWKTTNLEPKLTFDWESDIVKQLPMDHSIATLTRQDPGQILPWHQDKFYMLNRLYPDDTRPIWRFLIFMSDWKMGHLLQVGNSLLHHWQRGDVVVWHPGTMHVAANVGLEAKWTCNVTGFLNV